MDEHQSPPAANQRTANLASESTEHRPLGSVVVAGATGTVGAPLVTALRRRALQVVPIARSLGVDLSTGAGVASALAGADTVVDVTSVTTSSARVSTAFFEHVTGRLLTACREAGVRHFIALSIVGTDRIDSGYYRGKRAQERLVLAATTPHTILRATQFHEFAGQMLTRMQAGPVVFVPSMVCRPVAAAEVADRLADIVLSGPPQGTAAVPDFGGPEQLTLADMVRRYQRHVDDHRLLIPVRMPGHAGRQFAAGALLPQAGSDCGLLTFDQWLHDQPRRRDSAHR